MNLKRSLAIAGLSCFAVINVFASEGKSLFRKNCILCHGHSGKADIPLGKTMKARNLVSDSFKNGLSRIAIAETIKTGIAGTGMAPFSYINENDRLKLADYVLELRNGGSKVKTVVHQPVAPVKAVVHQPVAPVKAVVHKVEVLSKNIDFTKAKKIYKSMCSSCHGPKGKAVTPIGMALKARNFTADAYKQGDSVEAIAKTIATGIPGTAMAPFAQISKKDRVALAQLLKSIKGTNGITKSVHKASSKGGESFTKARKIYKRMCTSCHGPKGKAATPTGMALKARNFTADVYKQGDSVEAIAKTIATGIPGTAMAPFAQISKEDRIALAKLLKSIKGTDGISEEVSTTPSHYGKEKISATYAMQLLAEKRRKAVDLDFNDASKGWKLYQKNCASCHGQNGEGDIAIKMFSGAPYYRLRTEALLGHKGYWTEEESKFTDLVTKGLTGGFMPGNGTLTKKEMKDLYDFFTKSLNKAN